MRGRRHDTARWPLAGVVERKRHMPTDTDGCLSPVTVSPANLHDGHGGAALLKPPRQSWPFLKLCFADMAYAGQRVGSTTPIKVTIVSAPPGQKGCAVQPQRRASRSFDKLRMIALFAPSPDAEGSAATKGNAMLGNSLLHPRCRNDPRRIPRPDVMKGIPSAATYPAIRTTDRPLVLTVLRLQWSGQTIPRTAMRLAQHHTEKVHRKAAEEL